MKEAGVNEAYVEELDNLIGCQIQLPDKSSVHLLAVVR